MVVFLVCIKPVYTSVTARIYYGNKAAIRVHNNIQSHMTLSVFI